jgi:hypothetical protein
MVTRPFLAKYACGWRKEIRCSDTNTHGIVRRLDEPQSAGLSATEVLGREGVMSTESH